MKDIDINIGVYTVFTVDLSKFTFADNETVILSIRNNPRSPILIRRSFTTAEKHTVVITPWESKKLKDGAQYDFVARVDNEDGTYITCKVSDNGNVILNRGVGDGTK